MSGINGDRYELTATKALYWHGRRGCCSTLVQVGERHLSGFSWSIGRGGNWLAVARPEGATDREFEQALYAAVVGR